MSITAQLPSQRLPPINPGAAGYPGASQLIGVTLGGPTNLVSPKTTKILNIVNFTVEVYVFRCECEQFEHMVQIVLLLSLPVHSPADIHTFILHVHVYLHNLMYQCQSLVLLSLYFHIQNLLSDSFILLHEFKTGFIFSLSC